MREYHSRAVREAAGFITFTIGVLLGISLTGLAIRLITM